MFCSQCGAEMPDIVKFCPNCGTAAADLPDPIQLVHLRCSGCGNALSYEEGRPILICPNCGSKELVVESEQITLARIKSNTELHKHRILRDIELKRLQREAEKEKLRETQQGIALFKKSWLRKFIIAFTFICLFMCVTYASSGNFTKAGIALIQTLLFATAWMMGQRIIRKRNNGLHVVFAVAGFLLILPFLALGNNHFTRVELPTYFTWPSSGLSSMLPTPVTNKGRIWTDSSAEFSIDLDSISGDQFRAYVEDCKAKGFAVDFKQIYDDVRAFDEDGYMLKLNYYDSLKRLNVSLTPPIALRPFQWPQSPIAAPLPVPDAEKGSISWENSSSLSVYIGDMSTTQYDAYVEACMSKGFNIDYSRRDDSFFAYNKAGYSVTVRYEGNQIMSILINAPDEY